MVIPMKYRSTLFRRALDERLGFAHEEMGNNPIVPLLIESALARFRQPRIGRLEALGQRGAGFVNLLELVLSHRQHHLGLHTAVQIAILDVNFSQPFHRGGEVPLAIL